MIEINYSVLGKPLRHEVSTAEELVAWLTAETTERPVLVHLVRQR